MNSDQTMTDPYVALSRTSAGSREVVMEAANLTTAERRLLLIVNGHTPLADLLSRLPEADPIRIVHKLLDSGLITDTNEVPQARSSFPFES